jgi:hypothetical protein
MALNELSNVYPSLTPHVEEAAFKYVMHGYTMAQRVRTLTDMSDWNVRKVSEYLHPRRAKNLSEDTAIPDTILLRARKNQITPVEVGDRYRISDRRIATDLENIVADTAQALGKSIGDRVEADLIAGANSYFAGGSFGSSSTTYAIDLPIAAQFEFSKQAQSGQLWHVIHPFAARDVMTELVKYGSDTTALDFRNRAIAGWQVPAFGGLNIAVSAFVPRNIVYWLQIDPNADGGTFRLALGDGTEYQTGAITVSVTAATMKSNVKAALEALSIAGNGTWTVAGTTFDKLELTPPATLYLDAQSELRPAVNPAAPHVSTGKSAYDLITDGGAEITGRAFWIYEKSASCKNLLFFSDAIAFDIRQPVRSFYETVNQGRTAEYSAHMTYGVGAWREELGMFIETKANSAFAKASI